MFKWLLSVSSYANDLEKFIIFHACLTCYILEDLHPMDKIMINMSKHPTAERLLAQPLGNQRPQSRPNFLALPQCTFVQEAHAKLSFDYYYPIARLH